MSRRLALLNGLAIIAVVVNHAARWGLIGMFGNVNRLSSPITPTFSQAIGPGYYALVVIQQLCYFCVPAFLFISGYFMAFAAQGSRGTVGWKVVRTRISKLLWPYLIWSCVIFGLDALQGQVLSAGEYLFQIVTGKALGPYYYVPMLCQFYVLAPLISHVGKKRPLTTLAAAAIVEIIGLIYYYLAIGQAISSATLLDYGFLPIWQAFYFPLGMVVGFKIKSIQSVIRPYRWSLVGGTVMFGLLSILEAEWSFRATGNFESTHGMLKLSSILYANAFIFAVSAFDISGDKLFQAVNRIGTRSYGIYLLSPAVLAITAQLTVRVLPHLFSQQLVAVLALTMVGIGVTFAVMEVVARSPGRVAYRYLFG